MRAKLVGLIAGLLGCGNAQKSSADLGCMVDPPGADFTFRVRNQGSRMLRLTYGCGNDWPITLETAAGPAPIGFGTEMLVLSPVTCEYLYANPEYNGVSSDCGPGSGAVLDPGTSVAIHWDRRLYSEITAPSGCARREGITCALGRSAGSGVLPAKLRVCDDGRVPGIPGTGGRCSTPGFDVDFTVDLSRSEAIVEVP